MPATASATKTRTLHTMFMIAHPLSTLDRCDIRLELDHGRLIRFDPVARKSTAALT